MDRCAIDASVLAAPHLDEPDAADAERVLTALSNRDVELHAPDLMPYEVASALLKRVRRSELAADLAAAALAETVALPITFHPARELAGASLGLGLSSGATVYDAAYLATALRLAAPLVTLDRSLRDRALQSGLLAPAPDQLEAHRGG